jgi:WD40 repeat protein
MRRSNPQNLELIKQVERPDIVFALARKPGTGRIFCGGSDFSVYELDVDAPKPEPREFGRHESYVTSLALAGSTLVSGGYDGRLMWWDVDSRSKVRDVPAHSKWIRRVAATPNGKIFASVADDMVCRLWEASTGQMIRELRGHAEETPAHFSSMLYALAISSDRRRIATGDKVGHIAIWDCDSGQSVAAVEAPQFYTWDPVQRRHSIGGIRALAFSPDGRYLAAGGSGQISNIDHLDALARAEVFDWQKGERTHVFVSDKFKGLVHRLCFHPHGDWLLAGGGGDKDGFLLFYDLAAKKPLAQEKAPMVIHDLALNESGDTIYAVGHRKIAVFALKS